MWQMITRYLDLLQNRAHMRVLNRSTCFHYVGTTNVDMSNLYTSKSTTLTHFDDFTKRIAEGTLNVATPSFAIFIRETYMLSYLVHSR